VSKRRKGKPEGQDDRPSPRPQTDAAPAEAPEGPARTPRWALPAIIGVYVALGVGLAFMQPMDLGDGERATMRLSPPDESAHVVYFEELTTTWRLPLFTSGTGNYEAHQPPLYYLALAPLYLAAAGVGKAAAVLALRLAGVALGAVSIVLVWRLALLAFAAQPLPAVVATAIAALWPARLLACASAGNDPAAELTSLLALLALCRLTQTRAARRDVFVAGLLVGVAMLVKSSALPLVLAGLAAVYLSGRRARTPDRELLLAFAVFLAGVALLFGPWGVRNTVLYGDPLAAAAFERIFSQDRATPAYFLQRGFSGLQYYELVLWQTALSFWGVPGQANLWLPGGYYLLGGAWWAMAFGLAMAKLLARPAPLRPWPGAAWAVIALHLVLLAAMFLRFNAVFYQAQARYFMPATAAIGLLLARPWTWPRRGELVAIGGGLFCLLAVAGVLMILGGLATRAVPFFSGP